MSEEFEVHGPHDHAVHHSASHDSDPLSGRIAVMTAVLATIGAIYAYQSGTTENLALYYKNEAAIKKTEAANQWAYFQAKGAKQNIAELGATLTPPGSKTQSTFLSDIDKYKSQKDEIRAKAEALEKEVLKANEESEAQLHHHHRWAQATTLIQVSIAMAAITLLTRRRWLQHMALGTAGAALLVGLAAFLGV